jgi:methylmalonyl-CoA mutase cobalamin-binding domain/chain
MSDRKIRVLIAKSGLDGHDRGAKTVSISLPEVFIEFEKERMSVG